MAVGWPTPGGNTMYLHTGYDWSWSFQLKDANGNPCNFPSGNLYIDFPDASGISSGVSAPSSGSRWKLNVYGSIATGTVPKSIINSVPNGTSWYMVWVPDPQIRFDAVGDTYGGNSTVTWNHNITGNAVVAFANVNINGNTSATVTATCGGTAMTALGQVNNFYSASPSGTNLTLYAFGLLNPPTGTQAIALTVSPSHIVSANSLSYYDVGSFGTVSMISGPGLMRHNMFSTGPRTIVQAFSTYNGANSGYTQTQRSLIPVNSYSPLIMGDANAALANNQPALQFSVSNSAGSNWASIAVPLNPKSTATGGGYSLRSGTVSRS